MFKLVYKLFAFVKTTVNMVKLKNIPVSLTSYFKEKKLISENNDETQMYK